jgi:hypothetical protein
VQCRHKTVQHGMLQYSITVQFSTMQNSTLDRQLSDGWSAVESNTDTDTDTVPVTVTDTVPVTVTDTALDSKDLTAKVPVGLR